MLPEIFLAAISYHVCAILVGDSPTLEPEGSSHQQQRNETQSQRT
jgi:hypothetical protein